MRLRANLAVLPCQVPRVGVLSGLGKQRRKPDCLGRRAVGPSPPAVPFYTRAGTFRAWPRSCVRLPRRSVMGPRRWSRRPVSTTAEQGPRSFLTGFERGHKLCLGGYRSRRGGRAHQFGGRGQRRAIHDRPIGAEAPLGGRIETALVDQCPHSVEGDMRALNEGAGFDPTATSATQFCCDAQRGISYSGVVGCNATV
jgi:hypothetical protein